MVFLLCWEYARNDNIMVSTLLIFLQNVNEGNKTLDQIWSLGNCDVWKKKEKCMLASHISTFVIWDPPVVTKNHLFVSLPEGLADSNAAKFESRHLLLARLWCSNWGNIPHLVHHIQRVRFYRACTKFLQITPKIQTAIWQLKKMKYKIFNKSDR